MTKKTTLLLLGSLALGTLSVQAQNPMATTPAPAPAPATPSASWTFTPAFASQYMFRGVKLGGPGFQPSLEYDYDVLAIGVWSNVPFDPKKVPGQSNPEFDFYGSYKIDAIKDTLNFQPGYTIYTYPHANKSNGFYKATFEPNIAANYTVGALVLTPKIYYDFVLKGPTAEFDVAYNVPLKDAGTELDFLGYVGTYKWTSAAADTTPDLKNWGNYWMIQVTAPFQVTKVSKLSIGLCYTKGSDNFLKQGSSPKSANPGAIGRGVVTVSYAITF
jgi:uncharacterized protein (TIGR02001 family)